VTSDGQHSSSLRMAWLCNSERRRKKQKSHQTWYC